MRRRLLLVEDDPTLRQALTFNLTREGYEVTTAADGEAGARGRPQRSARPHPARRDAARDERRRGAARAPPRGR